MLTFRDLTLADRRTVESYTLRADTRNCDLAFANMFCWRDVYRPQLAVADGFLLIKFRVGGSGRVGYMQPLGDGDFSSVVPLLAADARSHGQRLRIIGLTAEGCAAVRRCGEFAFVSRRAEEDYIYRAADLRTLAGRRYQPKRNHINRFVQSYDYRYAALEPSMFDECMRLEGVWRSEHTSSGDDALTAEQQAMQEAFAHFGELGLRGGCIYVGDRMVAFTYGSAIDRRTFCIHIEKADTCYEGAFTMINRLFAESLPESFEWINREEDLGLPGLRRSKLSYHPAQLLHKYTALHLHADELACKRLWSECFDDDESFVDAFIADVYSRRRMLSVTDPTGRLVSMLHVIPMQSRLGRTAYIYGVATAPDSRGRGHASHLVREALVRIAAEGYDAAMLIPGSDGLREFYARSGFADTQLPVVFEGDFDFGTGDSSADRAMVRLLRPAAGIRAGEGPLVCRCEI